MSYDVQMFVLCDHYVNEEIYNSKNCPRCYGRDFYFDVHFDASGAAVLAEGKLKLQQELMKISIEDKGSNPFHTSWGSEVRKMLVGLKNTNITQQKIEIFTRNFIDHLRSVQESNQLINKNMTPEEMISSIESVEIVVTSQVSCEVRVLIRNKANELLSVNYGI